MQSTVYEINKGVNKPLEFRGLKAQYIGYMAAAAVLLLLVFAGLYVSGVSTYLSLPLVLLTGVALFSWIYRFNKRYGTHGLQKARMYRRLPSALICHSREQLDQLRPAQKPSL